MKIILLCNDKSNQNALAVKIAANFNLIGVGIEIKKQNRLLNFKFIVKKITDKLFFFKIATSWHGMLLYYKNNYPLFDNVLKITTTDINSQEIIDFITHLQPDLIMVSGTSLIKNGLLQLKLSKGIINLHTGLSPYVKGGPNCTNWCISNNTLHLIGNTVMWINKGIDSGNIITSDTVDFNGDESINEIHIKVMEHAHQLTLKALYTLLNNFDNCPSIKQTDIAKGQLFLTRMWNMNAKLKFMLHLILLNKKMQQIKVDKKKQELNLVKLPSILVVEKKI